MDYIPVENHGVHRLPPGVQRQRELAAIVSDPRLQALLREVEIVRQIEKTERGYVVFTDNFSVEVVVKSRAAPQMGPLQFELEFKQPVDRDDFHILPYPNDLGSLSPSDERLRELSALLSDPRLFERVGYVEMIERIEKTNGGYVVNAPSGVLFIEVLYQEPVQDEPIPFYLNFSELMIPPP